jgi:hypothetical protein
MHVFNLVKPLLPQGLPLGRKLSQFFFFFVWGGTSPKGAGKTEVFSGKFTNNFIFFINKKKLHVVDIHNNSLL